MGEFVSIRFESIKGVGRERLLREIEDLEQQIQALEQKISAQTQQARRPEGSRGVGETSGALGVLMHRQQELIGRRATMVQHYYGR